MQLKSKLDSMVGNSYLYNTNQVKILSYNIDGDQLTIVTDKKWIHQSIKHMNGFLDEFLELESSDVTLAMQQKMSQTSESVQVARDALIDNIKKIQQDPKYIPQANEIQKSAKSLIELVKAEIEVAKMISK